MMLIDYKLYSKCTRNMGRVIVGMLVMFKIIAIISFCVFHNRKHKKAIVGMMVIVIFYSSPLCVIVRIPYIILIFIVAYVTCMWNEQYKKIIDIDFNIFNYLSLLLVVSIMLNVNNFICKKRNVTKSVEFIPSFHFSLISFLKSLL